MIEMLKYMFVCKKNYYIFVNDMRGLFYFHYRSVKVSYTIKQYYFNLISLIIQIYDEGVVRRYTINVNQCKLQKQFHFRKHNGRENLIKRIRE